MPRPAMKSTSVAMIGWIRKRVTSQPLNQPSSPATRTGTTKARAMPMTGWGRGISLPRKIIGASAPAMAMSAPTDRSIPPVAMTRVIPTPTITMVQTWVRLTLNVCQVAKLGVMARLIRIKSVRAIQAPWRVSSVLKSTRGALRAGGRVVAVSAMSGFPGTLMPMSHGGHDTPLVQRLARQFRSRVAVAENEDAACRLHHLFQFRGNHQHAETLTGQFPDQA